MGRRANLGGSAAARAGFSLAELLVVIVVVVILATMLVPAVQLVRSAARSAVCAGNLRQLGIGMAAFASDYDGLLPPASYETTYTWLPGKVGTLAPFGPVQQGAWHNGWATYLGPYADTFGKDQWNHQIWVRKLFVCPNAPVPPNWSVPYPAGDTTEACFLCYGMNTACLDTNAAAYSAGWPGYGVGIPGLMDNQRQLARHPHPSTTILLAEHWGLKGSGIKDYNTYNNSRWTDPPNKYLPYSGETASLAPVPDGFSPTASTMVHEGGSDPASTATRIAHRASSNYLFVDGHVEALNPWSTCGPVLDASAANAMWNGR